MLKHYFQTINPDILLPTDADRIQFKVSSARLTQKSTINMSQICHPRVSGKAEPPAPSAPVQPGRPPLES